MAKFEIITGKALKAAIAGRGKQIATFTEREHQLAVSALAHLGEHNDVVYVQALYDMSPANYRAGLRKWFVEYGKCKFDSATAKFVYVKAKSTNIDGAMEIAPANFEKAKKAASGTKKAFDQVKAVARAIAYFTDNEASPEIIRALEGVARIADRLAKAAEREAQAKNLTVIEGGKKDKPAAKPAKAKKTQKTVAAPQKTAATA